MLFLGLLLVTLAAGRVSAAGKKVYKTPKGATAAPITAKLASLRTSSSAVTTAWNTAPVVKTAYDAYLKAVGKGSSTLNNAAKQSTFKANLGKILATNTNTKLKWGAAPNFFTDLSTTDRAKFLGTKKKGKKAMSAKITALRRTVLSEAEILNMAPPVVVPDAAEVVSVMAAGLLDGVPDWSLSLPDIKDQGACGSCWAFGTTAVVEAGHFINTAEVLALSEQQLVDCNYDPINGNWGCDGGWYDQAFTYATNIGLASGSTYAYAAKRKTCPAPSPTAASKLASYKGLNGGDEAGMLAALANGPIAVAVTVDDAWFSYSGGVYSSTNCGGSVNHAVVVVAAGVDPDTSTPFWLIRNSWGSNWGEMGYMRLQRNAGGNGMCNVAQYPYQATSADQPSNPPPPPPPASDCPKSVVVNATTRLVDIANDYKVSISQIMIDNSLQRWTSLNGKTLIINCPAGNWSAPFGVWNEGNSYNSRSLSPMVALCPDGHYAVQFYVKPSIHYTGSEDWTGSTWAGQITMACSDGSNFSANAQPNFDPGFSDGNTTLMTGFTSVPVRSGWAIDQLFGVGAFTGGEGQFNCPNNTMVTGFSAGTKDEPMGFIVNLQFYCSNPFGSGVNATSRFRALQARAPRFPRIKTGLSCATYVASATDTWLTVASKYGVSPVELMRANPQVTSGKITDKQRVFIPPCLSGVVHGSKLKRSGTGAAMEFEALSAPTADMIAHPEVPVAY